MNVQMLLGALDESMGDKTVVVELRTPEGVYSAVLDRMGWKDGSLFLCGGVSEYEDYTCRLCKQEKRLHDVGGLSMRSVDPKEFPRSKDASCPGFKSMPTADDSEL